ncbi:MFS transporter [Winogradskyella immobilis]|uniref:MFS transporter n=1 Tax=Winogradskyella immobilis TaxID=2816852 RepID=A0ABS8EL39_9FLAO|nr:MFS transporter [Winogradskyella immobilis]MCC1483737.1 MFS transporter [Winogradskyella immobilis]MCG0015831.1 MFS transporter [Winogradskyella immobilis]
MEKFKKGSKKLLNAWAFYDWANSVYTLTIASSIFPIFYSSLFASDEQPVYAFGFEMKQTVLISIITAFTFMVVALSSPILSGIADYVGNKKTFMKFFCYMGGLGCIGLYWFSIDRDFIHVSLLFYFMGLLGYWGSLVFYNSYLPDIAFEEQQDSISAKGFSMGYIGSVILLLINLGMVMKPEWFGFDIGETEESLNLAKISAMKISFITVGLWWILFSQYTFYVLPKGVSSGHKVTKAVLFNGFKELKGVWVELRQNLRLKRYLNAFFVFSMAVQTIMLMAVYFGEKEIAWGSDGEKTVGLIVSILVIQIVAILGAVLTSKASDKYGNIPILIVVNAIWMLVCIYAYFMQTPIQFYIAASVVGLVMGGVQSLGRSTYSKYIPENTKDSTSYFSFYDVAEKIGIVIGMLIFAVVDQISSMRYAILFLFVFFLIGIILLFRVPRHDEILE